MFGWCWIRRSRGGMHPFLVNIRTFVRGRIRLSSILNDPRRVLPWGTRPLSICTTDDEAWISSIFHKLIRGCLFHARCHLVFRVHTNILCSKFPAGIFICDTITRRVAYQESRLLMRQTSPRQMPTWYLLHGLGES